MKEHLLQLVGDVAVEERQNLAREYLQIYILRLIHELGAQSGLAFLGGSALRLLFRLPRFSEDLDFSAVPIDDTGKGVMPPLELFESLKRELLRSGYDLSAKTRPDRSVANVFFRFQGLPRELGVSSDPRLAFTIKVEIDTRPPIGGSVTTSLVQRFFPIAVRHYELPSLFAGKLHAVLTRPYAKGRDWFDLVWYLTRQPPVEPDLNLLDNALTQTGHRTRAKDWRQECCDRLRALDWEMVKSDLRPFVERISDLDQLSPALIEKLLEA